MTIPTITALTVLSMIQAFAPPVNSAASLNTPDSSSVHIRDAFLDVTVNTAGISSLRADSAGTGKPAPADFTRGIRPDNWESTTDTCIIVSSPARATIGPLRVWKPGESGIAFGVPKTMRPDRLSAGHTLSETFTIPAGTVVDSIAIRVPTWGTKTSGATLRLYRAGQLICEYRVTNAVDNAWQTLRPALSQEAGSFRVEMSDPVGEIGWWSRADNSLPGTIALENGLPSHGSASRTLKIATRIDSGIGTLTVSLAGPKLTVEANTFGSVEPPRVNWTWTTSWTKAGYDCTPKAGIVFKRFFTDNQRYLPIEQLKRRDNGGLTFDGCRWIEMDGTQSSDLRLMADGNLALKWEMSDGEMRLRFASSLRSPAKAFPSADRLSLTVLPLSSPLPDSFPRFIFPDARLTEDSNRFYWERAFSYPSPAEPAAWFEWMAIERAWVGGTVRDGEMRQLETYPITAEGYVHTWRQDPGWPLRPTPTTDTRHADTNARFILACYRYWKWSGDEAFLHHQADRLRRAMRYQLIQLHGADGLIVTVSKDVQGRRGDQSDNYWDILPFGHLDAYDNIVFYASLPAMAEMEKALGPPHSDIDYAALQARVHRRYDEVFWDDHKGRYIGCVDIDGARHDYGFTFVNIEALYYGLGDLSRARRIYKWLETEPTSSGKADTFTRFVFAPRATTVHNPMWGDSASESERADPASPWWVSWWHGRPFEEQCQDGGAILYLSFFDLMVRQRYFGAENAWKRWTEILERYRLPDRLCGGAPLFKGETPQQENAGQVGVDYPFPESGMVPCYLLYGVVGVTAEADGLRIAPHLPASLPWAEIRHVVWHGATLSIHVTRQSVTVRGTARSRRTLRRVYALPTNGSGVLIREWY